MKRIALAITVMFLWEHAMAAPSDYFAIHCVDDATGRGIPLVALKTNSQSVFYTDSNGYVAFLEPGIMNREVWFGVSSPGYEFPSDALGYRGKTLKTTPGTEAVLKLRRINIAERLYRCTGQGIYRDSVLLGKREPLKEGLLNCGVLGQDTAYAIPYQGELFWLWGDTQRAQYPLGNFCTTAARVRLPGRGGLDPSIGINYEYFGDGKGFTKRMCYLSPDPNPTWLDTLLVVKNEAGHDQLMAHFVRAAKDLTTIDQGFVIYDDRNEEFKLFKRFGVDEKRICLNHQFRVIVGGTEYFYGATPYPWIRVPATFSALTDPSAYEVFTCLAGDGNDSVERDATGHVVWKWRRNLQPLDRHRLVDLLKSGLITRSECPFDLTDVDTGHPVLLHFSSVYWNAYRKRWIMIGVEMGGASNLGEIWYSEANAPEGPWKAAKKVATHAEQDGNMDLYNPLMHPYFNQQGGRIIYFEGTYTNSFSGTPFRTPLYEYNNLMYRLDLSDPKLKLPDIPDGLTNDAKPSPNGAS